MYTKEYIANCKKIWESGILGKWKEHPNDIIESEGIIYPFPIGGDNFTNAVTEWLWGENIYIRPNPKFHQYYICLMGERKPLEVVDGTHTEALIQAVVCVLERERINEHT